MLVGHKSIEEHPICTGSQSPVHIHDFRYSHVSFFNQRGDQARRLGHSKIETTWNIYAHFYPCEEERAIAILNKIVYKSKTPLYLQGCSIFWWSW